MIQACLPDKKINYFFIFTLQKIKFNFMSTFTQILYQIVFSTKNRSKSLTKDNRDELYKYISGVLKNKKCHLYQIGGVEDHLHIVTHIHPSVALENIVKDIKVSSNLHIKENKLFRNFDGWQNGYGAFTYSIDAKENLIKYVMNQEEHHKNFDFISEYKKLLKEFEISFEEKYLL